MAKREIGTELKLQGEKEFNAQMKAVNNGLKTTKSDMAALSSEFRDNADSAKALTQKQKLLQASVEQHKAKVAMLRAQYEAAADALGEDAATTQKYKQQLNAATVALDKETDALEKNSDALREKYLSGLKALGTGAKNTLSGIGKAAGGAAKGIGKLSVGAVKVTASVAAAAATIGVAAVTAMVNFANESAAAAKAAHEAGETLTESQQKWLEYSNQLGALETSAASAKSALGSVLLPVLSELSTEGASFLNDFSADMEAAAGDTGKQAEVMGKYIAEGAKRIIANLPEYIQVAKDLISGLGQGLSESGPELLDMALDLVMDLLTGIIEFAPQLATAAVALVEKLVEFLGDQGPDLITAAVGMVTEIVSGLAKAAPDLVPAAVQLVSQLVIALIAAAPDLLLAGIELIYGLISGILNSVGILLESVDEIIETFKTAFGDKADEFKELGKEAVQGIKEGLLKAWEAFSAWFEDIWNSLFGNRQVDVSVNGTQTGTETVDGSHAGGLDYVPFDGYLARLHRGEAVLNSFDAAMYRQGRIPGENAAGKSVIMNFYAQTITQADIEMICDVVNRKLGEAM